MTLLSTSEWLMRAVYDDLGVDPDDPDATVYWYKPAGGGEGRYITEADARRLVRSGQIPPDRNPFGVQVTDE